MVPRDVLFFAAGAAALIDETIWARALARLVGSHSSAQALTLAVFMLGLGLGARMAERWARTSARPGRLFALCELFVALWAAASPWGFEHLPVASSFGAQVALALGFLLPPTLAMGATFPLMGRMAAGHAESLGTETARFYGANLAGACTGCLLGVFVLAPRVGFSGALWISAALDLAVAAAAWNGSAREPSTAASDSSGGGARRVLVASACVGAAALALEVIATRILVMVSGASVYAFALVVAVFLAGLGLGAAQARTWLARGAERSFSRALTWLPALALLGLLAARWRVGEDLFVGLENRRPVLEGGPWRLWAWHATVAALAFLPLAIACGVALPAAVARAKELGLSPSRAQSRVYAANTLGALCGSLAAGFLLLPSTGPRFGVALALAPVLFVAPFVAGASLRERWLALAATALLAAGALVPSGESSERTLLATYVGRDATVQVEERVDTAGLQVRAFRVNGKVEATSAPVDMRLQRLLPLIPALLHGQVERAFVLGCGSGMTAGALLELASLVELDLAELEPRVRDAARHFAAWNANVADSPRVSWRFADGRHVLAGSDERWDLITADPLHPWTRGASDLYSLEHFAGIAAHLAPGGIASQWLPLYELADEDVRVVVATWCAAFEHSAAWLTAYDWVLVGSNQSLPSFDLERALAPRLAGSLAEVGLRGLVDLAALQIADDVELREFARGAAPMRDDHPVLEFRAPFSALSGYSLAALRWSARPEPIARLPESVHPRAAHLRGLLTRFLDELPQGLSLAAGRYGAALLAP